MDILPNSVRVRIKPYVNRGSMCKIDIFYGEKCSKETYKGSIRISQWILGAGRGTDLVIEIPETFTGDLNKLDYDPTWNRKGKPD